MAPEDASSRYERHRSESEIDTEKIRKKAREEAARDQLLQDLKLSVERLNQTAEALREGVATIQFDLKDGQRRMSAIEGSIERLSADLEDHEDSHALAEKERKSVWSGVVPGIITSVASSLIFAAIIGGILYNALKQ
jgi:chromosome segregation ATPase